MAAKKQNRFWRIARRTFRWCRIAVWLLVLGLLILLIWCNRVGLPGFIKDRLVAALREHGIEVQFTRMRLAWDRGIVADNIQFGKSGDPRGLRASATEAELHLRLEPLLHRQLEVEGVALRGGHAIVPIWGTNDSPRELAINKVSGELRFLPNDEWELSGLRAESFGVKLMLSGTVANGSKLRHWKLSRERPKGKTPQAFWHDLVLNFERTTFEPPTTIIGIVSGDAKDVRSFRANVSISSPAIDSPLGKGRNFNLSAQITPQPGELVHAEVKLQAQDADTRWGSAGDVYLETQLTPSLTQWTPTNAHLDVQVKRALSPWLSASALTLKADFRPNPADATSSLADYSVRGQQIRTRVARFAQAELAASGVVSSSNAWPSSAKTTLKFAGGEIDAVRAAAGTVEAAVTLPPWEVLQLANTNLSWWARLDQMTADVTAQLTDIHSPKLDFKTISLKSAWQSPLLVVQEVEASLYDGTLHGAAQLDASTRVLAAEVKSDFDPRKISAVLTTNARQWLAQFGWEQPPRLFGDVRVTLPPWTNRAGWKGINWREDVLPTLSLVGNFQVGAADYRSLPISSAQSDFTYTNRVWHVPSLVLVRPEGVAHIAHLSDERTHAFQYVIESGIDLRVLRPLVEPAVQRVLDDFTLTSPPHIHAEISGYWRKPEETSVRATFAATNLGFRLQPALECHTLITLTNRVLAFVAPEVVRTEGRARADSVVIDIPQRLLYVNNGTGRLDPAAVIACLHPSVARLMAPYRFVAAPDAHVYGRVDLEEEARSDIHFVLSGGPFEWRAFRFQQIAGRVHWAGNSVSLSNVLGSLHGGTLQGSLLLDTAAKEGADFGFRMLVRDLNLHSLMADFGNPTNRLEGSLNGLLVVTNANTDDLKSWSGYGNMTLRDGLIWEVPVFGFFSPILNAILPGAGNSRAKEATATFIMTNSVIRTSDLSIRASGMQLNYEGAVDFETRISGRMEAELFRNTPGIGPVVSKVFWPMTKLFEYKVSGTFNKPKAEPLFIPKILMMPFHPVRTMRELLEGDSDELKK